MKCKQSGFSLVELLIGGSILAGIGLLGTQLMKNQKTTQQRIDNDLEVELLHTKISDFFGENAKHCDATFSFHYNQPGPIPAPPSIRRCVTNCESSTDAQLATGSVVFSINEAIGDRSLWRIESFGQLRPSNSSHSASNTNMMLMPVTYVHRTQNRRINKFVPIAMRFDSTGRFKQCIDASTSNIANVEREVCNNLRALTSTGGYVRGLWNADTQKCTTSLVNPNGNCANGVYMNGVEKDQGTRCVRFRDYPGTDKRNAFNRNNVVEVVDTSEDVCNFNIAGATNSFPRIYTDIGNRFVLRCRP